MSLRHGALIGVVACVGCAARASEAPPAAAPSTPGADPAAPYGQPPEPHIRDAEVELLRAERALDEAMPRAEATARALPPPPDKKKAEEPESERAPKRGGEAPRDPCGTACIALASMARSAEHLCRLAGPADARCSGARSRVQAAEERVRATCGACPRREPGDAPGGADSISGL
jgi:hypothetical protein